ncbi:MAG: hypothetical protein GY861_12695 [bacterium]|nr:hypothetical protein [bacterium]
MKLCISTVVDQKYSHFLPIFIYCCKNQYPEYDIKIFTNMPKYGNIEKALEKIVIESDYYNGSKIEWDYFKGWKHHKYAPISWRFLIDKEEYKDYDYVYITDIDMMILREPVELLHYHLNEMAATGLCYSNSLRNKHHWKGAKSLTGLHFASREWFEKTNDVMKKYQEKVRTGQEGMKREYDGTMLYNIVKESGLGMCKKYKLAERHHGIHLGNFRLFNRNKKLKKRMSEAKCRQWLDLWADETFRKICKLCFADPVVKEQITQLNMFCRKRVG